MKPVMFTLFFEYAGGTYVSQVEVPDLNGLPPKLTTAIDWSAIVPPPSKGEVRAFVDSVTESAPCSLEGLRHVWCFTGMLGDKLAMVHAVKTVP